MPLANVCLIRSVASGSRRRNHPYGLGGSVKMKVRLLNITIKGARFCTDRSMKLDLIIPSHNRASLLRDCLNSICKARVPAGLEVTVFVVDNRSTDMTRSVVESFGDTVQYIYAGRPGKSAALNDAIPQTHGEFVGFIDDDEQLDPSWFEVAYRELRADPELQYIGGQYYPNWEKPAPGWFSDNHRGAVGIVLCSERGSFSDDFRQMLMGGNAIISRETLKRVLPYPEELGKIGKKIRSGEDEVIYHRLLQLGAKGIFVPELIIYHWIPAERLTKQYFRKWIVGCGISVGSQLRKRGFKEAGMLGIPRYQFGAAVRSLWPMLTKKSQQERFTAQLTILDCFATLYGRHFY
jgi:glycosyltransferase involved in cell wall biosynthesis